MIRQTIFVEKLVKQYVHLCPRDRKEEDLMDERKLQFKGSFIAIIGAVLILTFLLSACISSTQTQNPVVPAPKRPLLSCSLLPKRYSPLIPPCQVKPSSLPSR